MDYSWRWEEEDFTMTIGETITLHIIPVPESGTEVFEDGISVGYIVRGMYEYTPTTTGTHILQYGNVIDCRPLNITVVSNKKIFLKVRLDNIFQLISNKVTSWSQTPSDDKYPSEKLVKDSLDNHTHNSQISYGQVDSTSTSTVFTATVPNLTLLTDGTTVMLRNGVVTSASGFTLNVNNLGAKPVYNSMANVSADTTIFNINYTMLFVYDSTRISGGCWICYRGYNTNDNTIGYQIRTNSQKIYATDKTYRYRILLEVDDTHYMPVNLSTSTSADVSKTSTMNTREFKLGGNIIYYSYTSAVNQNAQFGNTYQWKQYPFNLGFSFNNTNTALALTQWSPVYMVAEKSATNEGMAKLVSPYYTQSLPNSEDGKLYIFLGQAYNTTNIEMVMEHPIYEYKNENIRLYRDCYSTSETDTLLNGKANSSHTHTKSQITDFPTETKFITGAFNNTNNNVITANTSETTPTSGDRFYVHITDTSISTTDARISIIYNNQYNVNGVLYRNGIALKPNELKTDTILLIELVYDNGTSWNIIEAFNGTITKEQSYPIEETLKTKLGDEWAYIVSEVIHSDKKALCKITNLSSSELSLNDKMYIKIPSYQTDSNKATHIQLSDMGSSVGIRMYNTNNQVIKESDINGKIIYVTYGGGQFIVSNIYSTNRVMALISELPTKTSDLQNDGDGTNVFLTQHQSLTNYVQKSNTSGLLKNDGTVMQSGTGASNFAVGNHTHNYASSSHNHNISDLNNTTTVEVVVTYTDNTTETLTLLKQTSS